MRKALDKVHLQLQLKTKPKQFMNMNTLGDGKGPHLLVFQGLYLIRSKVYSKKSTDSEVL